jgi:hypothetical protein
MEAEYCLMEKIITVKRSPAVSAPPAVDLLEKGQI